jgi:hypothetical protein
MLKFIKFSAKHVLIFYWSDSKSNVLYLPLCVILISIFKREKNFNFNFLKEKRKTRDKFKLCIEHNCPSG